MFYYIPVKRSTKYRRLLLTSSRVHRYQLPRTRPARYRIDETLLVYRQYRQLLRRGFRTWTPRRRGVLWRKRSRVQISTYPRSRGRQDPGGEGVTDGVRSHVAVEKQHRGPTEWAGGGRARAAGPSEANDGRRNRLEVCALIV